MKSCKVSLIATAIASALALTIVPPAFAGDTGEKTERMVGQVIDDATITTSVKTKLLADDRTKGFDINVDTLKGKVTLRGGADTAASKTAATKLAYSAEGVVSVHNLLVVAAPGTEAREVANTATVSGELREDMSETGEVIDDAWITTKVKTQLLADEKVSSNRITVETRDNVVHLIGVLDSPQERVEAIRITRDTEGVRDVVAEDLYVRDS